MNIFQLPAARMGHRIAVAILFAVLAVLVGTSARAYATEGSQYGSFGQYGEVTRFGGFDTEWFEKGVDTGKFTGSAGTDPEPTAGKFMDPVGFAVDTDDEKKGTTAIYVLDRVSGLASQAGTNGTEWRLQKLSATGTPIASSIFYLPTDTVTGSTKYEVFAGLVGLAVDDSTGTIYTVVYDSTGTAKEATRQVDEIIDWSTTPNASGQLVAPQSQSTTDSTKTKITPATDYAITPTGDYPHPGVLSTESDFATTPLYEPKGLALDVTGGQDYLAIAANANKRSSSGVIQGPALVEQIATSGAQSGDEVDSWSAASLTTPSLLANASSEDATAPAAGISTDPDGDLNVLLATTAQSGLLDDIELPADLTSTPTVLNSSAIEPTNGGSTYPNHLNGEDDPDAMQVDNPKAELSDGGSSFPSPQVVELSNGKSLYAADFSSGGGGGVGYWHGSLNEGIRLVQPEADGLLSNPLAPVTSVYDTLANATGGGACNINFGSVKPNYLSLAAGADGTIWALAAGPDSSNYEDAEPAEKEAEYLAGREVIEFAPGAAKTCAQPAKTFTVLNSSLPGATAQEASSPLAVSVGSTVYFNASTIEYPAGDNGKPAGTYAYEWDPTLGAAGDAGYTTISDELGGSKLAPTATDSYTYDAPGVYTVALKLLGDFGEYDETGTVEVQTTSPPTAAFTAPSEAQTGQPVSFDASPGSQPASGASIVDYHWNFGDGAEEDTTGPTDTHEYAAPGEYTVTLTVRDDDNQKSASFSQQITITSPPPAGNGGGGGGGSTGGGNTGGGGTLPTTITPVSPTTPTTPPAKTSSTPKPLTTAQKLAAALKQCKKDKPKKKRETCEKRAKKKYAPKPKPKKKSKPKKK